MKRTPVLFAFRFKLSTKTSLNNTTKQLSVPLYKDGRFSNPWGDHSESLLTSARNHVHRMFQQTPPRSEIEKRIPVTRPDADALKQPPEGNSARATWLGQSSFLLQFGPFNFLTDPVFSDRTWMFGHKRFSRLPLPPSELPEIHGVVISHSHADHLDMSVVKLYGNTVQWFVPQNLGQWFNKLGVTRVVEMTWWDKITCVEEADETQTASNELDVICLPAQHHTQRTLSDKNTSLWCGFALANKHRNLYFAGDSGYCGGFREIGDQVGPFDLSLIPIGSYAPREAMRFQHCDPGDAVKIHIDIFSKKSVGMHWGTFQFSSEDIFEPPVKLQQEAERAGVDTFTTVPHGTTLVF